MKPVLLAACGALLLGPVLGRAADPRPAKPSPAVELARFTLPEENWNQSMQGVADQTRQQMEAMAQQQGVELPAGLAKEMTADAFSLFTYAEVLDLSASIMAKHYTDPELKELLRFYRTPLGQKMIRTQPEIVQDINGQLTAILQQRLPGLLERAKARVEKLAAERPAAAAPTPPAPAAK